MIQQNIKATLYTSHQHTRMQNHLSKGNYIILKFYFKNLKSIIPDKVLFFKQVANIKGYPFY